MRRIGVFVLFALAAGAQTRSLQRTFPLTPDGRVSVDTYKGSVRVHTWDKAEVEIAIRIEADSLLGNDREAVDATDVVFQTSSEAVDMRSDYSRLKRQKGWFDGSPQPLVHYSIKMPKQAALRIKDYKSEVSVHGLAADLDLETYKGEIDVRAQSGPARIKTYKSDASVEFAAVTGAIRLETYRGDYQVRLPRDARFDLVSKLGRHGTLDAAFALGRSGRSSPEFTVPVNGGGPPITIRGYRGTYRFR
jgi:hypothetical protein